jgi:hypothetical protein
MKFLSFMSTPIGRVLRVVMGIGIIAIGLSIDGPLGVALTIFGFVPPLTGIFGICPINPLIGRPIRCDAACRLDSSKI